MEINQNHNNCTFKAFMPRGNLHKVEYKKDMHEIDTCYRDSIGDDEDENFCLSSKLDS